MRKVKNVVRKGRVAAVDGNKVKFVSGEIMDLPSGTVIVDCSQNGTIFQRPGALKKVFEGKQINVQFIMLPPPGRLLAEYESKRQNIVIFAEIILEM